MNKNVFFQLVDKVFDRGIPESKASMNCCFFRKENQNFNFSVIEIMTDIDYTYSWSERKQKLIKCNDCGELFLQEIFNFKSMRYEDNDVVHVFCYPVCTREEALMYSSFDGLDLKFEYKGAYITYSNRGWSVKED